MGFISILGVPFVPLQFVALLQAEHEREIEIIHGNQVEAVRMLMAERRRLLAENAALRRYCGDVGGESEVVG